MCDHARYMGAYDEQLGDWKTSLKKVRDTVHKIFPRELSPTRLMEKMQTDKKKKDAAKLTKLASSADAANAAADASLAMKISQLQATALPGPLSLQTPQAGENPEAPLAYQTDSNYLPYVIGAAGLLALLLVARR